MTMEEHDDRADQLERQGDDLEEQSGRLRREVEDVRTDWEAKKGDGSLPGAQPADDDQPTSPTEEATGERDADVEGEGPQVQGGEAPQGAGDIEGTR